MSAILNTANYGIARGRISHIKLFNNNDGSKKYMVTVAARNAYPNPDGTYGSQYVRTEGFVAKNAKNDGVYEHLEVGDYVELNYIILNDDYKMKNGQWHYGLVLRIQGVDILETKMAKAARKAAAAEKVNDTTEEIPVMPPKTDVINNNASGNVFDDEEILFR